MPGESRINRDTRERTITPDRVDDDDDDDRDALVVRFSDLFKGLQDGTLPPVHQGITLGSVNMPEVQLRSLTLDEPNVARVGYLPSHAGGVTDMS